MRDVLMTDEGDLHVDAGDLVVGRSEEQTVWLLAESVPGEWGCSVEDGFALRRYVGAPYSALQGLKRTIVEGLRRNGIGWERIAADAEGVEIIVKQG